MLKADVYMFGSKTFSHVGLIVHLVASSTRTSHNHTHGTILNRHFRIHSHYTYWDSHFENKRSHQENDLINNMKLDWRNGKKKEKSKWKSAETAKNNDASDVLCSVCWLPMKMAIETYFFLFHPCVRWEHYKIAKPFILEQTREDRRWVDRWERPTELIRDTFFWSCWLFYVFSVHTLNIDCYFWWIFGSWRGWKEEKKLDLVNMPLKQMLEPVFGVTESWMR